MAMGDKIPTDFGAPSEWNEANFKMMRLHEIQEAINILNLEPNRYLVDGTISLYWIYKALVRLYVEGRPHYKQKHKDDVDSLRELIEEAFIKFPPAKIVYLSTLNGKKKVWKINQNNYNKLLRLLEQFEYKIRQYNTDAGLSTKTRQGSFF